MKTQQTVDQTRLQWEPGSFRDRAGKVFYVGSDVYRTIAIKHVEDTKALLSTAFFQAFMSQGDIVQTNFTEVPEVSSEDISGWVLQHEKIENFTYPYEWSFTMLKDAALTMLKILEACLSHGYILKDGTAWNMTYHRGHMCFVDVLSIDRYEEGQEWQGFLQFCQEFLYPLLVNAYKGVEFQQFFRGTLVGIPLSVASNFFGFGDLFKKGVFKYVMLQSKIVQASNQQGKAARKLKLPKQALLHNIGALKKIISALEPNTKYSVWKDYTKTNTYSDDDRQRKHHFIETAVSSFQECHKLIDLGCNTGEYARIAAQNMKVIACDKDAECIDRLYKALKQEKHQSISPLVLDLMNPSPNTGWCLNERSDVFHRIKSDGFLALAFMHHICIGHNVPLENFIRFLASIAPQGVVEWVDKRDPMVQFLLRHRKDIFDDYDEAHFKAYLQKYFTIKNVLPNHQGTRALYALAPRS